MQSKAYSDDEQLNWPPSAAPEIVWAQQPTTEASLVGLKRSGQAQTPPSRGAESLAPDVSPPSIALPPVPASPAASVEPGQVPTVHLLHLPWSQKAE